MFDYLTLNALPPVHPQTLILKARSPQTGGTLAAAMHEGGTRQPLGLAPGLSQLAWLGENGKIRQIDAIGSAPQPTLGVSSALQLLANQSSDNLPEAASILRFAADVDVDLLAQSLDADPDVTYVSRVPVRYAAGPPIGNFTDSLDLVERRINRLEGGSPESIQLHWNLRRIGVPEVEELGYDNARDIRVAVLDTGVDVDHPGLLGVASYGSSAVSPNPPDVVGHGTHVAGTINSALNRSLNIRGICKAKIIAWKIFDDTPDYVRSGNIFWYLVDPVLYRRALAECVGKVEVVNLSIGGPQPPDPQESALFKALIDNGTTVVAAMGNERSLGSRTSYPAAIPGVVAVGATSPTDSVAIFSNSGSHIALSAPGVGIWSTMPHYPGQIGFRAAADEHGVPEPGAAFPRDINYAAMDGTSMAAPHVSAAAALTLANSKVSRTPSEVRDLLMVTAQRLPAMNGARWTPDFGHGELDLKRLLFASTRL
ncbi:S8 family serine peptidase [Pseudarthrobacter sp. H3Y2-7]|uniref:S8 family serine peptidase n=1 Tax=Pseudarthrobacter naphthalenicus TaxID=3031328 RepID=UPI0023AF1676|nr:S8 family serine peptidase [Pseudarthrobacter sp. H3Y2-7]MDE8668424.1 S8 family serine peptidase [Pseudarthrobacter sp. H3Y2-7]